MGINELFDGITKVVEQFTKKITKQKLQERNNIPDEVRKRDLRKRRKETEKRRKFTGISRKPGKDNGSQRRQETP